MKKLYKDRGMLKWQGFLLAEHSEQLQTKNTEAAPLYLDEQALEEFNQLVCESYHLKKPISIQVNTFGLPYIEGTGIVKFLPPVNGRLELKGSGSFCMKDIVSVRLAENGEDHVY